MSGDVGIGTTSPWANLSVVNNGSNPGFIVGGGANGINPQFIVATNGNVGVGTTSPYSLLSIGGNAVFAGSQANLTIQDTTNNRVATIGETDGFNLFVKQSSGDIVFQTGGTNRLTLGGGASGLIDSVATTFPTEDLSVGSSTNAYAKLSVWGPDTSANTNAFQLVNNASTTLLSVNDAGTLTLPLIPNPSSRLTVAAP